jgi:hypothetical protein
MSGNNYFDRSFWIGTAVERAACTPFSGAYWIETDTGYLWGYWANAWHNLSTGGAGAPPTEGPGIDIIGFQVGLGGDSVLLYHNDGTPISEYATVALALADAGPGEAVIMPAIAFTEDITIPAGVSLSGVGNKSIIYGTVTLGGSVSNVIGISIVVSGNSAGDLFAVQGPGSGTANLFDVWISITNNGAGNAYGVLVDDGDINVRNSIIYALSDSGDAVGFYSPVDKLGLCHSNNNLVYATSISGDGYAFKTDGSDMYATDGLVETTTAPVGV